MSKNEFVKTKNQCLLGGEEMEKLMELLVEPQIEEVFFPGVDTSCKCKFGSGGCTICGNCIRNNQIAEKKGLRYDSSSGKFLRRSGK